MNPQPVRESQYTHFKTDFADDISIGSSYADPNDGPTASANGRANTPQCINERQRYNAKQPDALPNQLGNVLGLHFENCIQHNLPLISFHSPRGHQKCCDLKEGKNTPANEPTVATALQQLMAFGLNKTLQIKTSTGDTYTLVLNKNNISTDKKDGVPYFKATVKVTDAHGKKTSLEILEMAPQFDGKSLSQSDLKTCFELAKGFNHDKFPGRSQPLDLTLGQFSSAKGIGRSAALIVLSQFDEMLQTTNPASWPSNIDEVKDIIADFVKEGQHNTGNRQFGYLCNNDRQQALAKNCLELVQTKQTLAQKLAEARAAQPPVIASKPNKQTAALRPAPNQKKRAALKSAPPHLRTQHSSPVVAERPQRKQPDIQILKASIVDIESDAIVNAANSELSPGAGVCGAIYNKAGQAELDQATKRAHPAGCKVGEAKIVLGRFGELKSNAVIHAVGPDCRIDAQSTDKENLLRSAYTHAIELADKHKLKSIAFPAISTGVYGYAVNEATPVAIKAVEDALKNCKYLKTVKFCCWSDKDKLVYERALRLHKANVSPNTSMRTGARAAFTPPTNPAPLVLKNSSMQALVEVKNGKLISKTVSLETRRSQGVKVPINLLDINIENALRTQIPGFKETILRLTNEQRAQLSFEILSGVYAGDTLGSASESISPTDLIPRFYSNGTHRDSRILVFQRRTQKSQPSTEALCQFPLKGNFHTTDDTQQFSLGLDLLLENDKLHVNGAMLSNRFARPEFNKLTYNNRTRQWEPERIDNCRINGSANSINTLRFYQPYENWQTRTIKEMEVKKVRKGKIVRLPTESLGMSAGNGAMMSIAYTMVGAIIDQGKNPQALFENVLTSGQVTHPDSFAHTTNVAFVKLLGDCIVKRFENPNIKSLKGTRFFLNSMLDVMKAVELEDRKYGLDKHICTPDQAKRMVGKTYRNAKEFSTHINSVEAETWRAPRLPHQFLDAVELKDAKNPKEQAIYLGSVAKALDDTADWGELDINNDAHCRKVADFLSRWNTRSYLGATLPSVIFLLEKFGYDNPLSALKITALVTQDNDTCGAIVGAVLAALHGGVVAQQEGNVKWGDKLLFPDPSNMPNGSLDGKGRINNQQLRDRYLVSDLKSKIEIAVEKQ